MNRDGWDFYVVMGADNVRADDWRRILSVVICNMGLFF